MGIATFLVALVPTYEQIGIWGAVILTVLRFIQGIGVGGEWGGSVLMAMEWARSNRSRGFLASWPQFGVPCGLFLANLAVLIFSRMSGEQFLHWGRSEEHTSELQSQSNLVCRLLLEKQNAPSLACPQVTMMLERDFPST